MLSKELLNEVLNIENSRISRKVDSFCFPNENTIALKYYMKDGWEHLNIYELAHKCKEWACKGMFNGYYITSFIDKGYAQCTIISNSKLGEKTSVIFEADTEPEVVFKATSYILENKDEKET
jgi:hypothetical protein